MLQRNRRVTIEEVVEMTRDQLRKDFLSFQTMDLKNISTRQSVDLILQTYSNTSSPLIGTQVIKQKLSMIKFPLYAEIDMILDKAEMLYLQSFTQDLERLKNEQKITNINFEEVRQYIEEMNWKYGFNRESILNQSQQIGQNIDLMKFFQGVRNYQNQQEQLQKSCLEKLKNIAHQTEKTLTFQKGFIIAKIQNICKEKKHQNQLIFFRKLKSNKQLERKLQKFQKMYIRRVKTGFENIIEKVSQKPHFQLFQQLMNRLKQKKAFRDLFQIMKYIKINQVRIQLFNNKVEKLFADKKRIKQNDFFKRINNKRIQKTGLIHEGSEKLKLFIKKKEFEKLKYKTGVPFSKTFKILNRLYEERMENQFSEIKIFSIQNKKDKIELSTKFKGRLIAALQKHEEKPINLKKTFLNWYLKGNEKKYTKQVYNIWLNGNISKFTFFMRMKNAIDRTRKYKIKYEMKLFLMVFQSKMNKYYDKNQKGFIKKWHDNTLRLRKIEIFFKILNNAEEQLNKVASNFAFKNIYDESQDTTFILRFINKYLGNYCSKVKKSIDEWKKIPSVKKKKGRVRLRRILENKIRETEEQKRQTYNIFKENRSDGRQIKRKICSKVINRDELYRQKFLMVWKFNKEGIKTHQKQALKQIERVVVKERNRKVREFLEKLRILSRKHYHKRDIVQRTFTMLISENIRSTTSEVFSTFKDNWRLGKNKKDKLVYNLVAANKMKQAEIIYILKTRAEHLTEQEKRQKVEYIFSELFKKTKKNLCLLYQKERLFLALTKISNNYTKNIQNCFKKLRSAPPRINWKKRDKVLRLHEKLSSIIKAQENKSFNQFKYAHHFGKFKMMKAMDIMAYKYLDVTKTNFNMYRKNVAQMKANERHKAVSQLFSDVFDISKSQLQLVFMEEAIWSKKSEYLKKLNDKLKERLGQAFRIWNQSSKAIGHFQTLNDEKKKRLLESLHSLLNRNQLNETKKSIYLFKKNANILKVQTHFLKKLCDSQAGKVIKAMMVWKNLPQPKNKELIGKATRFQSNLSKFAHKIMKSSFEPFKNSHYFGNQKKKMAIRKLVARSCSGIQNYFDVWKKNNSMITIFKKCHKVQLMANIIMNIEEQNLSLLFVGDEAKNKERALNNIEKWWQNKQKIYLTKLRTKTKESKQLDELKKEHILRLASIQKSLTQQKLHEFIQKLKEKTFLKNALGKYFIQNHKNKLHQIFKRVKGLPDHKKTKKMKKIKFVIKLLEMEDRKDKNQIFEKFRSNKYTGNFKKNKAFEKYIQEKIGRVHQILGNWNNLAKKQKSEDRIKIIESSFHSLNEIFRAGMSQLLSSEKQLIVKKNAIDQLFRIQQSKFKGGLLLWKERARQLQISQLMENTKKKQILEKLTKLVDSSSDKNVKKSIKMFYLNFKIDKIQKKFIQKLLQTKSGKVIEAFSKWKDIPNQNLMEKYKKAQKFYFKLEKYSKDKLKQSLASFMDDKEEGNAIKKQSVLKLFDATSNGMKKLYNRWIRITKRDMTLKQVTSMMNWMDSLHTQTSQMFDILFQDQKTYRIKVAAIEKLISASGANSVSAIRIWRQKNKELKIFEAIDGEKKKTVLRAFSHVLNNSQQSETIKAIQLFKKNTNITKISRNFFNKLLQTKSGKVVQLFEKWKSIPDIQVAKKKKKAIKFESQLNKLSLRFIKRGFDPFKNQSFEARNRKKYCIDKLVRASMGEQKKKFLLWKQIVKEQKILNHSKLFEDTFRFCENKINFNTFLLFKDTGKQVTKKKWLCRRLIDNSNFVQHHAYFIWKEAHQVDNVKIQKQESKVKSILNGMINVHDKVFNRKALQIIHAFKKKKDFKESIKSTALKEQKNKKILSVFNRLNDFANSKKSRFLKQMKNDYHEIKIIQRTVSLQRAFEGLEQVTKDNMNTVFRSNKDTIIIQNALKQLFANVSGSVEYAIRIWRQKSKILAFQDQINENKKKQMLSMLTRIIKNNENVVVPLAIKKFHKNWRIIQRQKQILNKILHCKAGKVPMSFMLWKSLPNPGSKVMKQKAMKFQNGLRIFYSRTLKKTFESFKDELYEGNSKKRFAGNKLIMTTMSDTNRYFNIWKKLSSQANLTDKLRALSNSFSTLQYTLQDNFVIFHDSKIENLKKVNCLKKLINRGNQNLSLMIGIWRKSILDNKVRSFQRTLDKFSPQIFNKKLVKESFESIQKKKDMEVMRVYINSLWKWKLSNLQASYYGKFIKVFKESQEMIILSNCINKKLYQNLHIGFRSILSMSSHRQNRKTQITQKYLMRKYRNYFQLFKFNVFHQQIKNWKSRYTVTVKGQKLAKGLVNIIQTHNLQFFKNISENCRLQRKVQEFTKRINHFLIRQRSFALKKLQDNKIMRFISISHGVQSQAVLRRVFETFSLIKETNRTNALVDCIKKISDKLKKKQGFTRIYVQADRNTHQKLAILLMSNVHSLVKKRKITNVLGGFKVISKKTRSARTISNLAHLMYLSQTRELFKIGRTVLENQILLSRFRKGMTIKRIMDKQDKKLAKKYFQRMKKRENPWLTKSIRMFATHSSIKSSVAVSLWRMKAFKDSQ